MAGAGQRLLIGRDHETTNSVSNALHLALGMSDSHGAHTHTSEWSDTMNPASRIDERQQQRLNSSLVVLLPRVTAITAEFCTLLEVADPSLRLRFPSDERQIEPVIEQLLGSVADPSAAKQLAGMFAQQGSEAGVEDTDLPTLLAAIQTAIAEIAGYTWTNQLEQVWTRWFDGFTDSVLSAQGANNQLAA